MSAPGYAGALGDAARGGVRVPVLDQAGDGRVEQRLPGGGAAGRLAATGAGGSRGGRHLASPSYLRSRMNVSVVALPAQTATPADRGTTTPGGPTDGSRRGAGVRRDPNPTRQGKVQRIAARHQARRPGRGPYARDPRAQRQTRPLAVRRRGARLRLAGRRPGRRHRQDGRDQGGAPRHRGGRAAQPLLRLGPGGRQRGRPEGRLRLGGPRVRRRCGVDVARADGLRRRGLGDGPRDQLRHVVRPPGGQCRPDRDDRGVQPRGRGRVCGALPGAGGGGRVRGTVRERRDPGQGPQRERRARPRRVHPSRHHRRDARRA